MNFDKSDLETMLEAWKIDPYVQEVLAKLGSDYDKDGVPYWENEEFKSGI